jgi:XTP/dITP diphosphohydrolase
MTAFALSIDDAERTSASIFMNNDLLIATRNSGKIRELAELLRSAPVRLIDLGEVGIENDVEETGTTFAENSDLKAAVYAKQSGIMTVADDSGLVIDALDGAPGVISARYAGPGADDAAKIRKVLAELSLVPEEQRTARFVCSMSVADSSGKIVFNAEGVCEGRIMTEPRGYGGFGYDPIFVPEGFDLSFGELPPEVKAEISHRARATRLAVRYLQGFFGGLT